MEKVILVDCDGVLLNWEHSFNRWMIRRNYKLVQNADSYYKISERFNISNIEAKSLIRNFNESANIGFLPPHKDAIRFVEKLHKEHGYVFHVITSLSLDPFSQKLRTQNLITHFGEGVFEKFVYLDTGADKDVALMEYSGTECFWIEDKPENAREGNKNGLRSILMDHAFNRDATDLNRALNWAEVYGKIVG